MKGLELLSNNVYHWYARSVHVVRTQCTRSMYAVRSTHVLGYWPRTSTAVVVVVVVVVVIVLA